MTVMLPYPGHEQELIDSMHRFGAAARTQPGLVVTTTTRDPQTGERVGIAVWESAEAARAAGPVLMAAVDGDDFDAWFAESANRRLDEV
jgi:hypothetical protein